MGLSGISPGSLLLIFLIFILLFGTKRLASFGEDLGRAIQGFKKGLTETKETRSQLHHDEQDKS